MSVQAPVMVNSNARNPTFANAWTLSLLSRLSSHHVLRGFLCSFLRLSFATSLGLIGPLLGRALHSLSASWDAVFVIIVSGAVSPGLLTRIDVFQVKVFYHTVGRGQLLLHARRQNLFEKLEILHLCLFRELDVELDVQVAEVVVSHRRHTLALDHLDSPMSDRLAWVDVNG